MFGAVLAGSRSMTKILIAIVAACGGSTVGSPTTAVVPPAAVPTPSDPPIRVTVEPKVELADSNHLTEFQIRRLLGHYSTIDGKAGFVLDRTVDPPRVQLDGDPYVKVLGVNPSVRCCVEYNAGNFWVRIDNDTGAIVEFQGDPQHEGVRVIRDADAAPLQLP
jgi:hypothetical protein